MREKPLFRMQLVGKFNVYNALGAIAAALAEGFSLEAIRDSLERITVVEGRMEIVNEGQDYLVLVDYAHTPDGLENALSTVSEFAEGKSLRFLAVAVIVTKQNVPLWVKLLHTTATMFM